MSSEHALLFFLDSLGFTPASSCVDGLGESMFGENRYGYGSGCGRGDHDANGTGFGEIKNNLSIEHLAGVWTDPEYHVEFWRRGFFEDSQWP